MNVYIAHASIDERGKVSGGKAGDQTGREVCVRKWYSKPWNVVIRFKDENMRKRIAEAMQRAANNALIGYDQSQRNTLLTFARFVGYDPGMVTSPCETDCSALVCVACMYAGVPEEALYKSNNCATTSTLKARLKATGMVDIYSSAEYTRKMDNLIVGDILLKEGSHVAVVVRVENDGKKTIHDIALEVIDGKWGTGSDRKKLLTEAGYNYREVQNEVNNILR